MQPKLADVPKHASQESNPDSGDTPKLKSLDDILAEMSRFDEEPEEVSFDPAEVAEIQRDKVDAIKFKIDELEGKSGLHDEYAAAHLKRSATHRRNAKNLEKLVAFVMKNRGYQKLPGREFRLRLFDGQKSLSKDREPKPEDFYELRESHPGLVKQEITYKWDFGVLRTHHKAGTLPEGVASEKPKAAYIQFYTNTPETEEAKS